LDERFESCTVSEGNFDAYTTTDGGNYFSDSVPEILR